MVSLNNIAENIAFRLREQYNETLKESIKLRILAFRALFIRRDLERNALSYTDYLINVCVELEEADKSFCPGLPSYCSILKSKQKVAKPLRLKTNGSSNFKFVGIIDKSKSFVFTTTTAFRYMCHLPFQDVVYYGYENGHIVVYNNPFPCKILLEYIPADPRGIDDCNHPNVLADDLEFPLPLDMIAEIENLIVKEYTQPIDDGEEINIDRDGRN